MMMIHTFIATSRTYTVLVFPRDVRISKQLYSMTKSFSQQSAWFNRWWYFEWLYVRLHTIHYCHTIKWSNQTFAEPVVCPAQTWFWRDRLDGMRGRQKEKYCCFLSCHIPPPPTVSYGRRVMNILHCVFWHSRKIHLVSWQKCTSGTRRHPALAPQDRLLSSTASTSHAFLKSLVKDGHGYWKQKLWNFDLLAVSPRVRHVFVTFFHNSPSFSWHADTSSLTNSFSRLHSNHVLLKYLLLFCTKERK